LSFKLVPWVIKPLAAPARFSYEQRVIGRRVLLYFLSGLFGPLAAFAQIDPEKRQLIQLGYNAALVGHAPFSGYAFYYVNKPHFIQTNLTLRMAIAPVYLDSELGISGALGEETDIGIGLAGGGFADSYAEIAQGKFERRESFTGHGGEFSVSLYHRFNPSEIVPLNAVLRGTLHYSTYSEDDDTADDFAVPSDRVTGIVRAGIRWGGKEPTLFPKLGMELSIWYEGQFRTEPESYGFADDRRIEPDSHLFWAQALLAYTFERTKQNFYISLTAGSVLDADRFSAFRLGALLPLVREFPLSLPGYYYQEISARQFVLMGGNYIIPLDAKQRWNLNVSATTAGVDYLPDLGQEGHWHSGVGAGLLYRSPGDAFKIMVGYAYGVDAIRNDDRGAHSIGVLMQLDLQQAREVLLDPEGPWRWRGWEKIFGVFGG
jgi:hypothetical protein